MRLGLVVSRKSHLRQLAPIAERAVADGDQVWLLADHRGLMTRQRRASWAPGRYRQGKTWEFPDPSDLMAIAGGRTTVEPFASDLALLGLADRERLDAVLCVNHQPLQGLEKGLHAAGIVVGQVQAGWDLVYSPNSGTRALFSDVIYGYGDPWREWWVENLRLEGVGDDLLKTLGQQMQERFVPVGYPGADLIPPLNRVEIRARLGLPLDRPIVVYLPFPIGKLNTMRTLALGDSLGARQAWLGIYGANRAVGALNLVRSRRWRHWPYVAHGWNDRRLVENVRRFCVANGALLVVKSKHQTEPRPYLRAAADHLFHDGAEGVDHPPLLLQLLAVADLCIHFGSGSFVECAVAKVPSICVLPGEDEWPHFYDRREHFTDWRGVYEFGGVAQRFAVPEFIRTISRRRLEDFRLDETCWQAYMSRFFTTPDGGVAARILDDLARRIAEKRPGAPG